MSETTITLRGRVGSIPASYERKGDKGIVVRFRFAVSNWRRTAEGAFVESEATWYTVRVWDTLAENVLGSVSKGDPLIVAGRPSVNAWIDRDGLARGELVITAQAIGFDMNHGRSRLIRSERRQDGVSSGEGSALDAVGGDGLSGAPANEAPLRQGTSTSAVSTGAPSWPTTDGGVRDNDPTPRRGTPDRRLGDVSILDADEEVGEDDQDDLTDREPVMSGVSDDTPGR